MEEVNVNGQNTPAGPNEGQPDPNGSSGDQPGANKSVINISNNNVTILSTGTDGRKPPSNSKVTTTPLRTTAGPHHDSSLPATGHVNSRVKDTQFVSALTQQFQANGGSLRPPTGRSSGLTPTATTPSSSSPSSSRASHSRSSSSSSTAAEDLTSKLSSMLLQQQQQQQHQRILQQQQNQQQQSNQPQEEAPQHGNSNISTSVESRAVSDNQSLQPPSTCAPSLSPAPGVENGGTLTPNGRGSGASSPEVPPTPPPSALMRSVSEQVVRKVDASYTPRPKSYSTQTSGTGNPQQVAPHNKNDLMSALTAVVTSGSAVAGLRKTRGPRRGGGVTEVFASKKTSGASGATSAAVSRREEK